MAFDRRFTVIAPPIPETFCVGPFAPIRVEDDTQPPPTDPAWRTVWENNYNLVRERWLEIIRRQTSESSRALHQRLHDVYGPHVKATMIEPSSSIVVRSEHQFNQQSADRMALRIHMYELVNDGFGYTRLFHQRRGRLPLEADEAVARYRRWVRSLKNVRSRLSLPAAPIDGLVGGQPISEDDVFGHYFGFLDVRPWFTPSDDTRDPSAGAPLALGLLVPPRRYLLDPRAAIITGDYSAIFGGPPFASTVYCQHDQGTSGALCAQAALVMALAMVSDRGARVDGCFGMTYRGWLTSGQVPRLDRDRVAGFAALGSSNDPNCRLSAFAVPVGAPTGWPGLYWHFPIEGLDAAESARLLAPGIDPFGPVGPPPRRLPSTRVSPGLVQLARNATWMADQEAAEAARPGNLAGFLDRLAQRIIEAYVSARFPVVLYVDWNRWRQRLKKKARVAETSETPAPAAPVGHAVTVIGYRRWRHAQQVPGAAPKAGADRVEQIGLITHDPGHVPFFEQPIDDCIAAAWAYPRKLSRDDGEVLSCLGVADQRIKVHPLPCIQYLLGFARNPPAFPAFDLRAGPTLNPQQPGVDVFRREVARFRPYATEGPQTNGTDGRRFRIRLAHAYDLDAMFGSELPNAARDNFRNHPLPAARHWCVLGYDENGLRDVWAFRAEAVGWDATWTAPHPYHFDTASGWSTPPNTGAGPGVLADLFGDDAKKKPLAEAERKAAEAKKTTPPKLAVLNPSVITSCSPRNLAYLFGELSGVDQLKHIDLFTFRETDLLSLKLWLARDHRRRPDPVEMTRFAADQQLLNILLAENPSHSDGAFVSTTALLGNPARQNATTLNSQLRGRIVDWLRDQIRPFREPPHAISLSAFATYLPDITAADSDAQEAAKNALRELIDLALDIHDCDKGLFPRPVIEIVCGTLVDRCRCKFCAPVSRCFVARERWKIQRLVGALKSVVQEVLTVRPHADFAIALELEPGDAYLLRGIYQMTNVRNAMAAVRVARPISADVLETVPLTRYVGFNIDIGHMLTAGVTAEELRGFRDSIVHSHISDLPGIHARDHVPATFTFPRYRAGECRDETAAYAPYVELLRECHQRSLDRIARRRADHEAGRPTEHPALPDFSGACALELEGCGRIDWVHRGVSWMKRLFA